ncbi:MAG: SH3 domain-containing protein [Clostridia bacterium]|nr:SH3 domain-containing protein [Clostridia bacterium]
MTAQKIINMAASQIGTKESPANSNNVKYNTDYYGRAVSGSSYPWCCAFIWWIFNACGASELFYGGKKTAYCPTVESYYKANGMWFNSGKPGDLVLFDFTGKGISGHIGIVESANSDGSYTTIEGNTGSGNDANGGTVMRRTRYKSSIRGFARPNYASDVIQFTETSVNLIGTINASVLNIRKQPSTASEIIGKHSNGDVVNITAKTDNGWYRVDYPNIGTGYLYADYVSVAEPTPEPVVQQPYTPPTEEKDNVPDAWAETAVQNAIDNKIIFGDDTGDLKLHKNCTRQEMLVFLYRFYKNII